MPFILSFNVPLLLWLNSEYTVHCVWKKNADDAQQYFCYGGMTPLPSWCRMNKVAFLGPIVSKSERFTSFSMPDLESKARNYPRNNVLNLVGGGLTLNFVPLKVVFRVAMCFWCWNPWWNWDSCSEKMKRC